MIKLFTKTKVVYRNELVIPKANFKAGDKVVVRYLTETKIGEVIGQPFIQRSIWNGTIDEFIPVRFSDDTIDSPPEFIIHKL